jgi:hypothetical protein
MIGAPPEEDREKKKGTFARVIVGQCSKTSDSNNRTNLEFSTGPKQSKFKEINLRHVTVDPMKNT